MLQLFRSPKSDAVPRSEMTADAEFLPFAEQVEQTHLNFLSHALSEAPHSRTRLQGAEVGSKDFQIDAEPGTSICRPDENSRCNGHNSCKYQRCRKSNAGIKRQFITIRPTGNF